MQCYYLCLTLSISAAARLLVLSPNCLLQVGQCSTLPRHDLQIIWPAWIKGINCKDYTDFLHNCKKLVMLHTFLWNQENEIYNGQLSNSNCASNFFNIAPENVQFAHFYFINHALQLFTRQSSLVKGLTTCRTARNW